MIQTKVKDWKQTGATEYETPEGYVLKKKDLQEVCDYYSIPGTLLAVDTKYNTNTFQQIASKASVTVGLVTNDEQFQVLDPKSVFLQDDRFELLVEATKRHTGVEPVIKTNGFSTQATFTAPSTDKDSFIGDAFNKSFRLERLAQGGLDLTTQLLRLACTNGMMVPEKQYHTLSRKSEMPEEVMTAFYDSVLNLDIDGYFKTLFTKNGEPLQASVADYLGMSTTLSKIGVENVEVFFPTEEIELFYKAQGVDITTINRNILNRLPSGLQYYQCFNILTHAAKLVKKTRENEVAVASWCRPSRMQQLMQSDITIKGAPKFDFNTIKSRMGDK